MMHRRMIDAGERSRKHLGTMPRKLKNIRSREIKEQYDEIRASLAARGIEPKLPEVHPETENA